jgi:hypothetical protein
MDSATNHGVPDILPKKKISKHGWQLEMFSHSEQMAFTTE